jgi:hypothetical protein
MLAARNSKHGMAARGQKPPEYGVWRNMIHRCTNPEDKRYADWGGRGISVCDSWLRDFAAFYAAMGPRPTPRHSIDRIDNDGDYEPGNCRWATPVEQAANKRMTIHWRKRGLAA